jgi:regulator of protease activity HflC (stomatin/prohibitin superfamily)
METIQLMFRQIGKIFMWWATVYPWEQALRIKLGKHIKRLGPGIHLKIPLVHQIVKQNARLFVANAPRQTLTTKDGQIVTASVIIGYTIVDIEKLYMSVQNVGDTINNISMGTVAEAISGSDKEDCTPEHIARKIMSELSKTDWGLKFSNVQLNDFAVVPFTLRLVGDSNEVYTEQPRTRMKEDD